MDVEYTIAQDIDVFVSYSSKDKLVADAVVAAQEQAGIRCWYAPRDIPPGADWAKSITKAIHDTAMMVLVFSGNSNRSQRVLDEINYAISEGKPILPFRIEAVEPSGALRLHLSSRHWLDAYDPTWEAHIESLVRSVRAILAATPDLVHEAERRIPASPIPPGDAKRRRLWGKPAIALGAIAVLATAGIVLWNALGNTRAGASDTPPSETPSIQATRSTPTQASVEVMPTEPAPLTAVLHGSIVAEAFSLDPQKPGDSTTLTANMFLSLTGYDIENASIIPAAAESWTFSPEGNIYTFKLRPDIPWVTHSLGGETVQVLDEDGEPRYVSAEEFEYAYKRLCDPRARTEWDPPLIIKGCREAYEYEDPENIPPEFIDDIGIRAVSETELIFELEHPSGYFLTSTFVSGYSALPIWAIEKYGDAWMNPGLIPTYGTYVIDEWVPGESIRLVRNELLSAELWGGGNIQTVELRIVGDGEEAYEIWKSNLIDYSPIPENEVSVHLAESLEQAAQVDEFITRYLVFDSSRSPFDNIHLRRAFSAAFDRVAFIENSVQGQGIPMKHLAPPGIFGAPPADEVGVGYDLAFARSELELAGYPQCQGLPQITFSAFYHGDDFSEETIRTWEENLACPPGTITFQVPPKDASLWDVDANILYIGWRSAFPDEEGWVGDLLYCDGSFFGGDRTCNEIDDLIDQARQETNAADRIALYRQIEEAFFGYEGTFPLAPIYAYANYGAVHDWLERTRSVWGIESFQDWSIDMDAKGAARGD